MDSLSCYSKFEGLKYFKHKKSTVSFVSRSEIYAPVPLKYWIFLINLFILLAVLTLNNPAVERCRFIYFIWCFGTACHERANNIHFHGYSLGPGRNYLKQNKKASSSLLTDLPSHLFPVYITWHLLLHT